MKVALIVTGHMEMKGLAPSLQRLFPEHLFEVQTLRPETPFPGFTSTRVGPVDPLNPPSHLQSLVEAAAGALIPEDSDSSHADLVLILEDLEQVNRGNEVGVISAVRRVAELHLARQKHSLRDRIAEAFRTQVSFHLAVPMPEAWFFGDPSALQRVKIPIERLPPKLSFANVEDFEVTDPQYLADAGELCASHLASPDPKYGPIWLRLQRRSDHPKAYLSWLCRRPEPRSCTTYDETKHGTAALSNLDWATLLRSSDECLYARAMIADLAEGLRSPSLVNVHGNVAPLTCRKDGIFRNL